VSAAVPPSGTGWGAWRGGRRSSASTVRGLDASSPAKVAENLAAVLRDGKRVLVSGVDAEALSAVRDALPAPLHGLCLDSPRAVPTPSCGAALVAGHREPGTGYGSGQALPNPEPGTHGDRVAALCRAAGGRGYPPRTAWTCSPSCSVGWTPADWPR